MSMPLSSLIEETRRRAAFLAEASRILASSLDYETTLATVARLAVPQIADWCQVDVVDEQGTPRMVAIEHADPVKVELARELQRRFPPNPNSARGVYHVLRTGKAELEPEIRESMLTEAVHDPEQLRILRELGLRSYICVPLEARGKRLGVITFVAAESGRRYGPADLELAEDLSRRCAQAIDNAQLYKQAQEASRRSEESRSLLEAVLQQMPAGVIIAEAKSGRVLLTNTDLGAAPPIIHAGDISKLEDYAAFQNTFPEAPWPQWPLIRALRDGEIVAHEEMTYVRADGSRGALRASAAPVRDREGNIVAAVTTFYDITERKQVEQELRATSARLAGIIGSAMDAIITVDAEQRITVFNEAAEKMFGYSSWEAMGKPLDLLIPARFQEIHREHIAAFGKTGVTARSMYSPGQLVARRAGGEEFPIEASISQLDVDGHTFYTVILRDVTQRQLTERALRESEKLAATGRLAATIAHEINNPLESITNVLYLLEKYPRLEAGARQYVVLAEKELQRVVHITRQTLGFYREAAHPGEVRLAQVVEDALAIYDRQIQNCEIAVEKRFDSAGVVSGFPGELRQVISNLLSNALDALPQSGSLKIHIYDSREWKGEQRPGVRVVVADNGAGIAAPNLQRVFEPFFTTKGEKGTGLGLWVISGIVRKHGGHIRVRSSARPGHSGTCFSVFIPANVVPVREAA